MPAARPKYRADPDAADANNELASFGPIAFARDREGISTDRRPDGTGYILVSDQQANRFRVFPREGLPGRPHEHPLMKTCNVSAIESDGSEVTSILARVSLLSVGSHRRGGRPAMISDAADSSPATMRLIGGGPDAAIRDYAYI